MIQTVCGMRIISMYEITFHLVSTTSRGKVEVDRRVKQNGMEVEGEAEDGGG